MNVAVVKEIEKKYLEAVDLYENSLLKSAPVENYVNLSFLYWSFAFELFEFNIPNHISDRLSVIGGNRYAEVLDLGLNRYPDNLELHFWQKYFLHISAGRRFSDDDCRRLIADCQDNESVVPYFFLYLYDRKKYEHERALLLDKCNAQPTAKNLYIKSIIESR